MRTDPWSRDRRAILGTAAVGHSGATRSSEKRITTDLFPRSASQGRSPQEIVDSFGYSIWTKYLFVRGSVCPECYGTVDVTKRGGQPFVVSVNQCRECRFTVHVPVDVIVAFHPVVIEAFWQHGVSLLDVPLWRHFEYTTGDSWEATVESTDPFATHVTITLDDATLRLAVADDLSVTQVGERA
ncbi:hypothetical protein ACFR9U_20840 [Halorientalis brevis]|uniref:DUF7351 domain-containing protein n=1 Tax=Halorientalis brevis TaxID=1126241 RepID=A0ABD6CGT9_9EURY|nr:hypothetical protein [Halorientalis brevis]